MAERIISSFDVFEKSYSAAASSAEPARVAALKRYFQKGGVVSVMPSSSGWPKLVYPTKIRLRQQMNDLKQLKELFQKKRSDWQKHHFNARIYRLKLGTKKFIDPLYWKHVSKTLLDSDYKQDANAVNLPVEMVVEKRYKPMVEMFVNDLEYRKQLAETVKSSIVYRKEKKLARYADTLQDFRKNVSSQKLKELEKKIKELESDLEMLSTIMKWVET